MQDTKVKTKALDKGNGGIARFRGKETGVKATSPRTETGYEAGDADELASAVARGYGGTSHRAKSRCQRHR